MIAIDRRRLLPVLAAIALPTSGSADALPLVELPGSVEAPAFAFPDLTGTMRSLPDFRGRPLLVNFWAVWCAPCRRELAALADLRMRLADARIEVLAINLGDSSERIASFLAEYPAPGLPVLLDRERTAAAPWHVSGLPVAYAVDPNGVLRFGAIGERDWRASIIERQLRSMI